MREGLSSNYAYNMYQLIAPRSEFVYTRLDLNLVDQLTIRLNSLQMGQGFETWL